MENSVCSLYVLCLSKVSELLVKRQRNIPITSSDNPFLAFHPNVLYDLISFICSKVNEKEEFLKSSYLYLLLISGRITFLELTDVKILRKDAEEIFNYLQPYSMNLKSIIIDHDLCSNCLNSPWMSYNLGTLLHSAKNLVCLESSINFKLSELSRCANLEKLTLNFKIRNPLNSFLHVGNKIRYNYSLKMLRILKIRDNLGLYLDIAEILQYCVEIVEIDYDVSHSLVHLHEIKKATKYKLQKTCLGIHDHSFGVSRNAIQIASLYCPDLRTVNASTDYRNFEALSNFRQITDLTLSNPEWPGGDFDLGVRPLLQNCAFGHNLKSLVLLVNFFDVDFSCIGTCCPNLEELKVNYFSEDNITEFSTRSFLKLISLYLENTFDPCGADTLIGILSKATFLEFLTIRDASMFNDSTLDAILENAAAFSRMKTLIVDNGGLTIHGLKMLVQSMFSIEYISYTSDVISSEDIESVIKANKLTCSELYLETLGIEPL